VSPETARKIVIGGLLVGGAAMVYGGRNQSFATNYRKVWGLILLAIGGAALADFAPQIVGPYMIIVILVMLLSNESSLGGLFSTAGKAAGGSSKATSSGQTSTEGA
jgi:hypothetical protein